MRKLSKSLKNIFLSTLAISSLFAQTEYIHFFHFSLKQVKGSFYDLLLSLRGDSHEVDEDELIQAFSRLQEAGSLAGGSSLVDQPELLRRIIPHLTYTPDGNYRSDDFVRKLIAHYSPDSAAYANLPSFPRELLENLQKMEKYYQEAPRVEEEENLDISDLESLYELREEQE
jgi:hypothetical protein